MATKSDTLALGDRYEILAPLGSGAAANVFRVRDRRSGALLAAKVLKPLNAANPKILARFEDEFRILRTLHHPHLPEVYDYGWTEDGGRFLIMELVDGVPLNEYFQSNPADIWAILYELCETLKFVHDRKLLHQDIKPANILVKRTTAYGPDLPLVKLIDFGLIYKRDAGMAVELVGTVEYMAPEVARGEAKLTRAVDYYSLGATLFELLTAQPPFVGSSSEVLHAHLEQTPWIEEEEIEWAELYPHVRALLGKEWRARLEAFEELRRAVVSRLTGGIAELDRAYGLARIESLPMISKEDVDAAVAKWLGEVDVALPADPKRIPALEIRGRGGVSRNRVVDSVCAECAIRGFHIARFGGEANAGVLRPDGQVGRRVDRYNKTIARFEELHPRAILMVVDGIEHLSDDEASFIRYLSTRRELAADPAMPVLFIIARGRGVVGHPLDPYLPPVRQSIEIPVDSTPSGPRDGEDHVRALVVASAVFEGARSGARRRLLAYIASHPGPVPREWAVAFADSSEKEFADDLDLFVTRHLVSKVVVDAKDALIASEDARSIATSIVPPTIRERIHRDFAERLAATIASSGHALSSVHELIAYHCAAMGDERAALVERIRAVRAAWNEGSLSDVTRLSQASLESLTASTDGHVKAARRHFVKEWVRALWARNQHTRAKRVIDDHILKHGDAISPALLPKYIRGILDSEGPAPALEFVEKIDTDNLSIRTNHQVLLEKALLLCQSARHEESLNALSILRNKTALDKRDRHRVTIYRAMNMISMGSYAETENPLREASIHARVDGCIDESVLMSAILAQERTVRGQPREALTLVAGTLTIAHRHELYLRTNLLYRLAATAYQDLSELRKAIGCQQKAIALASSLGLAQFEAMSWNRLSEYERALGNFGNAIRYLERANAVMLDSSSEADRVSVDLAALGLHIWLLSPDKRQVVDRASWVEQVKDVNERGRYFMMMGNYWTDNGAWDKAHQCYLKATELLERAEFVDNLIMIRRARLRLALLSGETVQCLQERRAINAPRLRAADSATGRLERNLALLEFAFCMRSDRRVILSLCNTCLQLCDASAEASTRLEGLALAFRALARSGDHARAEATFRKFYNLLRLATSNLEHRYVEGFFTRLNLDELSREFDLIQRRNEAGVTTGLVA